MKSVAYTRPAIRQLTKLPDTVRADLIAKINRYAADGTGDVKSMKGSAAFRLRAGDYRIIFEMSRLEISVVAAGHRRDIYR